jgi:tetratricopeptide (TPR) repeat protein
LLRYAWSRSGAVSQRTETRLADDVAAQAAQRLGTLAILTAVTVVAMTLLQQALQPELAEAHQTPLFRLAALFFVLASAGLAALERSKLVRPQALLDIGLVFRSRRRFCHRDLGELERAAGKTADAINELQWVVKYFPESDAKVYVSLALAYQTAGKRAYAQAALDKGKRIFPGDQLLQKFSLRN